MLSACRPDRGGRRAIRFVSLYAPNGRVVDSPFYAGKLAWYARLRRWLDETASPGRAARHRRRLQHRPDRRRRLGRGAVHGATHVSQPERAAFRALLDWGLVDAYRTRPEPGRYTWWDYRAGNFHKNYGMRIDHLLVTRPGRPGVVCRHRPRGPQGHAGAVRPRAAVRRPRRARRPIDTGWGGAEARIAARRATPEPIGGPGPPRPRPPGHRPGRRSPRTRTRRRASGHLAPDRPRGEHDGRTGRSRPAPRGRAGPSRTRGRARQQTPRSPSTA